MTTNKQKLETIEITKLTTITGGCDAPVRLPNGSLMTTGMCTIEGKPGNPNGNRAF